MGHITPGGLEYEIVHALPLPQLGIDTLTFFYGLVGACRVDFKGSLAVHPVVGAAQTGSFRANGAHVVGSKGLAECAGVIGLHIFILHLLDAVVSTCILASRPFRELVHILFIRIEGDLHLIQDV